MPLQGSMSVERMCQFAQVSRAGFYRSLQERTPVEKDMDLRSSIQQIVMEHRRRYGYRRVSAELRRRGMLANHKRVARIMKEDNLASPPTCSKPCGVPVRAVTSCWGLFQLHLVLCGAPQAAYLPIFSTTCPIFSYGVHFSGGVNSALSGVPSTMSW
jgi:transposase InsO family protein